MKPVYYNEEKHACIDMYLYGIDMYLYDKEAAATHEKLESDTHVFYMTEPQPIEEEKVECDHRIEISGSRYFNGIFFIKSGGICPRCGEEVETEK